MIDKNDKSSIYDKPEWKSEGVTPKDFFDQCGYMVIKGYLPKPLALYFKNYLNKSYIFIINLIIIFFVLIFKSKLKLHWMF